MTARPSQSAISTLQEPAPVRIGLESRATSRPTQFGSFGISNSAGFLQVLARGVSEQYASWFEYTFVGTFRPSNGDAFSCVVCLPPHPKKNKTHRMEVDRAVIGYRLQPLEIYGYGKRPL